jgi:hypothetical protein
VGANGSELVGQWHTSQPDALVKHARLNAGERVGQLHLNQSGACEPEARSGTERKKKLKGQACVSVVVLAIQKKTAEKQNHKKT